jgi:hypothetical protein
MMKDGKVSGNFRSATLEQFFLLLSGPDCLTNWRRVKQNGLYHLRFTLRVRSENNDACSSETQMDMLSNSNHLNKQTIFSERTFNNSRSNFVIVKNTELVQPNTFEPAKHWYPSALNATIHPMVAFFLRMGKDRIIERYCHMRPQVTKRILRRVLSYKPKYYRLAGADLLHVTTAHGRRQMVVIENNSCPSGQKSMPLIDDHDEYGGYVKFMEKTVKANLKGKRLINGVLAIIYDKNYMEASGYAAAMADVFKEQVYLVPFYQEDEKKRVRVVDEVVEIQTTEGEWKPVRACFRYLTQQPWDRLPMKSKTIIYNPIVVCLAGGRNKLLAEKAYSMYNASMEHHGLVIATPETMWDVNKAEIPFWVQKLGGKAVVKIPYSNAGQGVYTIVNKRELDEFMALEFRYSRFIVQSLIGNYEWSSDGRSGKFYHVGTVPNKKLESYVLDFRIMVHATEDGYQPLNIYARRAKAPLPSKLSPEIDSWDCLGTNLSYRDSNGEWAADDSRLLLMDRKGFNQLGIGLDDLVEAYIQTVLSTIAIDRMAQNLIGTNGKFKMKLFSSLNEDEALLNEILK